MHGDGAEPPIFALEVTAREDGGTTVAAAGELDIASADEFTRAVVGALATGPVTIDLARLTFMDSSGVRAMNIALHEAAERRHELRVSADMQPGVVQVLRMTGMLGLLPIEGRA